MVYLREDAQTGVVVEWYYARKEMDSRAKHLRASPPDGFKMMYSDELSVPTTKRLLVSWLNRWCGVA